MISLVSVVITLTLGLVTLAHGQTNITAGNVDVEYDNTVFNITDVSVRYDDVWGPTMIGLIQNNDQFNTIEGVALSVQMYDKNNHLIGVMKGYPQSTNIYPNQKTAFEIQSGDEEIRNIDHIFIEILATDWGSSYKFSSPNEYESAEGINSSDYQTATNTTNNNSIIIRQNDMEPYLKQNDTVMYSNSTSFDNLKTGDIIVFRAPEAKTEDGKPKVIVHRISEIGTFFEKPVIRTKGDANVSSVPGIDFPIFEDNYIGKVVSVTHNNNTTIIAVDNQTDNDAQNEDRYISALK